MAVAAGVGALLLGAAFTDQSLVRFMLLVAAAPGVIGLGFLAPPSLVYLLAAWMASLGLLRRLLDTSAGNVAGGFGDPLLLVGPLILLVLAAVARQKGALRDRTRLANAVLVLSVLAVIEVVNPLQGSLLTGAAGLLFFLVPMLAFWVGRALVDDTLLRRLLTLVCVLAFGSSLYGLFQQYRGLPGWDASWVRLNGYEALNVGGVTRAFGTMSSSSEYATFLGIGVVVCLAWLTRIKLTPVALGIGGVLAFAMFQDGTRGVVVLCVAAAALMWAAQHRLSPVLAVGVGGLGLVVLVFAVGHSGGSSTTSGIVQHQVQGLSDPFNSSDSTLPGHFSEMVSGLRSAITDPFGHGTGSVTIAAGHFGGNANGTEVDPSNVGVALGVVGLLAFVVVVIEGLREAYRLVASSPRWWTLAAFGILVVTFLQWTNGGQYAVAWLPWIVLGWVDQRSSAGTNAMAASPIRRGSGIPSPTGSVVRRYVRVPRDAVGPETGRVQ